MRLIGLKIQVRDGSIKTEFPVNEVLKKLPLYLDMNLPEGQHALKEVCKSMKAFAGELRDYKERPFIGLGDPLTIPNWLSRPYSELLGVPLTLEEVQIGLGDPKLTGCVLSLGGLDAGSHYNAFLNKTGIGSGVNFVDTGIYKYTNSKIDKEQSLSKSSGTNNFKDENLGTR